MRTRTLVVAIMMAACGPDKPEGPEEGTVRIGQVMVETGHRFELAGRAARAERWELADYEVEEIDELFESDMRHALLPPETNDVLADQRFEELERRRLPALRRAAQAHDQAAFARAYAEAAGACNGCHTAARHAFVVVPPQPGSAVPDITPAIEAR